jgi:hypothetical protein
VEEQFLLTELLILVVAVAQEELEQQQGLVAQVL